MHAGHIKFTIVLRIIKIIENGLTKEKIGYYNNLFVND